MLWLSAVWKLAVLYRRWVAVAAILAALGGVYLHIRNDGIRDTTLATYTAVLAAKQQTINNLNVRITRTNNEKLAALAEAERQLNAAHAAATAARADNARLAREATTLRLQIQQVVQDNETFAIWANGGVPADAWRLLHGAGNPP